MEIYDHLKLNDLGGVGGGNSHIKKTGTLVVSLSGCKLQSLVSLRVVEMESYYIYPFRYFA